MLIGSVKLKLAPSPFQLSAQILPPCASTISRDIASPRPELSPRLVAAVGRSPGEDPQIARSACCVQQQRQLIDPLRVDVATPCTCEADRARTHRAADGVVERRLGGEGEKPEVGEPGDLYVFITVEEHEHLIRDQNDLHYEADVPFTRAMLGHTVEVEIVNETVTVDILQAYLIQQVVSLFLTSIGIGVTGYPEIFIAVNL